MRYRAKKIELMIILLPVFSFVLGSLQGSLIVKAETSYQEIGEALFGDVIGLDPAMYNLTTIVREYSSSDLYWGVLPETGVDYMLNYGTYEKRVHCTFVGERLYMFHSLGGSGVPILSRAYNTTIEMAKEFLGNYQTYTGDSFFGELLSTLDDVEVDEDTTIVSGNMLLEVTNDADEYKTTTFKWTYTFNGVSAPSKFVALSFRDGRLSIFVNPWQFYNVGSTAVNLSEEEAIDIALETAKNHSWSLALDDDALEPEHFNETNVRWTALLFDDSLDINNPRSEDLLEIYPVWRVGVALDKWYGNMYGIQVEIWADTKEIRYTQEAWSMMTPPDSGEEPTIPEFSSSIILSIFFTVTLVVIIFKQKLHKTPNRQQTSRILGD